MADKCELVKCTPGKIWLALAILSVIGSINDGWKRFLLTIVWEVVFGWGVAALCRHCAYGWLWAILIIFTGIPLAFTLAAIFLVKKNN